MTTEAWKNPVQNVAALDVLMRHARSSQPRAGALGSPCAGPVGASTSGSSFSAARALESAATPAATTKMNW